jgi:hypothetical protein
MTTQVIIERLNGLVCPFSNLGLRPRHMDLRGVTPITTYREERRGLKYHQGRILHFVHQLEAGEELDPIVLDNECSRNHVYPYPVLLDGNHRLISCILMRRPRIRAEYGGRVDLLRYLQGRRKTLPSE